MIFNRLSFTLDVHLVLCTYVHTYLYECMQGWQVVHTSEYNYTDRQYTLHAHMLSPVSIRSMTFLCPGLKSTNPNFFKTSLRSSDMSNKQIIQESEEVHILLYRGEHTQSQHSSPSSTLYSDWTVETSDALQST